MSRDAIPPEGRNAVTASTFAGHIGLKFSEVGSECVCGSLTVSAELQAASHRRTSSSKDRSRRSDVTDNRVTDTVAAACGTNLAVIRCVSLGEAFEV
jgi:hypothetical protein